MHPGSGRRSAIACASAATPVAGLEVAGERVADDPPRPGVEDDREIDEALRDRDVGDVADPELVGTVDLVVFGDERKDRPVVGAVGRARETPPRPWVELVLAHQPAHLLGIDHWPRRRNSAPTRR